MISFTYKLLIISRCWKFEACSSKQERNFYSNMPIMIFCQNVKNNVILTVKNFSNGEYGDKGWRRA